MSSVLARFRKPSSFQALTDARDLRGKLFLWLYNEKNVPKKNRKNLCDPIDAAMDRLIEDLYGAQKEFGHEDAAERVELLTKCQDELRFIWRGLQKIDDVRRNNGGIDLQKLEPHLDSLEDIAKKIAAAKKTAKAELKL